ncbi:MAG: putative pre-16S rRNA nuclease [Candidatus Omnitrophica bacterium]|nr:putative pre-16S rRNA nuclease [Candidatus Omnitrophota bacterium]
MRILAIDLGDKRIGLAISDPLGYTAQGLETLENKGVDRTVAALKSLCSERGVTEIVIGLPVNMDGTEGPKARLTREWMDRLARETGLGVASWDERLTSRQAGRLMIQEGLSRQKQKQKSDQLAAILILQGYLDSRRHRATGAS